MEIVLEYIQYLPKIVQNCIHAYISWIWDYFLFVF